MAYNTTERFSKENNSLPIFDPGSYQTVISLNIKPNKVSFLTKSPRKTQIYYKIWTHAIYNYNIKRKIPNCTSISSKTPRFAYENWIKDEISENIDQNICHCGVYDTCQCPVNNKKDAEYQNEKKVLCQAKHPRKLFKGTTLKPLTGDSLSCPLKRDQIPISIKQTPQTYYDARVIELNSFYRGCKWSRRTSQRTNEAIMKNLPGPADYNVYGKPPSYEALCVENLRELKRKTAQQLRFLEKVQRQNVLESFPGPACYNPTFSQGTELHFLGPKAKRFKIPNNGEIPGPTKYNIKRDFDVTDPLNKPCLAKLPASAPFGVRDSRFRCKFKGGPSPATYDLRAIPCRATSCRFPSFGSTAVRFKDNFVEENIYADINRAQYGSINSNCKHLATWGFRSRTIRMKPLSKKSKEPSPADLPQSNLNITRSLQTQNISPFFSSEPRFRNWYNWIPVQGNVTAPGPAHYNLEKIKCLPSVKNGPLFRANRFVSHTLLNPAPNEYKPTNGIEDVLKTYNQKLKNKIVMKHTFYCKYPPEKRIFSKEEQELRLLNKSIKLLDIPDVFQYEKVENKKISTAMIEDKPIQKLLRYFLYAHQMKQCF